MTLERIQSIIKAEFASVQPYEKADRRAYNQLVHCAAKVLLAEFKKELKESKKEIKDDVTSKTFSEEIQFFVDNPMSEETQAKKLSAMYYLQLDKGELNPAFLTQYDKIVGVATEKDDKIEPVDSKDAFPSYAQAIDMCSKPMPKVDEE